MPCYPVTGPAYGRSEMPVAAPCSQGDFTCPSGQSLFLHSVTYRGTTVSDDTGNSLGATPDPISTGPIHVLIG